MPALQLISSHEGEKNTALKFQRMLDNTCALAMEKSLNGGSLDESLSAITDCLVKILNSDYCKVLLFDAKKQIFRTRLAKDCAYSTFIEQFIQDYLDPIHENTSKSIKSGQSLCTADIYAGNAWPKVHPQAKALNTVASWLIPINGSKHAINGCIVLLFNAPKKANKSELLWLQQARQSMSALINHSKSKTKALQQKVAIQHQYLAQKEATAEATSLLKKAVAQRTEVQGQLIEIEKMAALGTMMSSLTHEINTPIGVSLTAASFLSDMQDNCMQKLDNDMLKRSELINYLKESVEASHIIQRNMQRAVELIQTFKRLSVDQDSEDIRSFVLCDYVYEVLLSLKPRLKHTPHKFCVDIDSELTIKSNPGAFSQLLINLIMNSANHAFDDNTIGRITIQARLETQASGLKNLVLKYKDNGKGMDQQTIENIYKPFFSLAREADGCGLGMHICNNIVMKVLKGTIDCQSELGKGVEFTIVVPA
ncbi:GAF domain-containing sensor histidine kinase [Paraglaciecola aestuariivivens]